MTAPEPDGVVWHTSSYSTSEGDCLQVAPGPDRVLVRDSKDPAGLSRRRRPTARTRRAWSAQPVEIRTGVLDQLITLR